MGVSKTKAFADSDLAVAAAAKALAHPARIAILRYLIQRPSCVCGDIVNEIGLAQATVSQHLKVLKEAGYIQGEISGPSVCYCINPKGWMQSRERLLDLSDHFPKSCKTC
jgi:DNA-binding transcriptional ArsR family regulator